MTMYSVTTIGQDRDDLWGESLADIRYDIAGKGFVFQKLVEASSQDDADFIVRGDSYFRKVLNQQGADWKTIPLFINRVSAKDGLKDESMKEAEEQALFEEFERNMASTAMVHYDVDAAEDAVIYDELQVNMIESLVEYTTGWDAFEHDMVEHEFKLMLEVIEEFGFEGIV